MKPYETKLINNLNKGAFNGGAPFIIRGFMFNNDKLQAIVQLIAVGGLVVALIMSILWDRTELSTNIASGLVGFIGGAAIIRKGEDKWH